MTQFSADAGQGPANDRLHRAMWRWHFYAGLYVIPFFAMLAITGLIILWFTTIAPEYGERLQLRPAGEALALHQQAEAALKAHQGGRIGQYIAPYSAENPALFRIDLEQGARMIALNPYTGEILQDRPQDGTWKEFATRLHGELLMGTAGDLLIEAAASLGILMLLTGLFLWWPDKQVLPKFAKGTRSMFRSLHASMGLWLGIALLFFLLSGLAWAGIWGERYVQAWSTFPAEKWEAVPLSDKTHASLNHGAAKEVPWALEQTPLPQSTPAPAGSPVTLESVAALGRAIGLDGRFQLAAPMDETGVWTLSRDSVSYDSSDPMSDRTVHVDQYTGEILASVGFEDYPLPGKAMAVGIALHEGQLGWWNIALNVLFCFGILGLCATGILMWWLRRPAGRLGSPHYPKSFRLPVLIGLAALALCVAFPVTALPLALFALVEFLLPQRFKQAGS